MYNMDQPIITPVEDAVKKVMEAASAAGLSEQEQKSLREKAEEHFNSLVIETLLNRLTDEQAGELERSVQEGKGVERKVRELAASVPGLSRDMEDRLDRETEAFIELLS